jgi:ATP-dependent DNA helicase 2 subunit 1
MRGQKVDEVSTKTQYTSAETGAELDAAEITTAYQLGDEAKIVNVLELNWWETEDFQKEQAQYAEELLRLTSEHKSKGDAMDVDGVEHQANGLVQDKINVRTRVQFSDKEIASFRSMDVDPRKCKSVYDI